MSEISSAMSALDAAHKKTASDAFAKAGPAVNSSAAISRPASNRPHTAAAASTSGNGSAAPSVRASSASATGHRTSIGLGDTSGRASRAASNSLPASARSSNARTPAVDLGDEPLLQLDTRKDARAQKVREGVGR